MPVLSKKELEKSISFEIEEKSLAFDMDSIYYRWDILDEDEKSYSIMSVTTNKKIIDIIKDIKRPGWSIKFIGPQFVTAQKLIEHKKGISAIIDFGHTSTRVMIYKNGNLLYIHSIEIGGESLTKAICKKPDLLLLSEEKRWEKAERLKHTKGAVVDGSENDPEITETANLLSEQIRTLSSELKQSLQTIKIKEKTEIDKIYFTGNAAKLQNLIFYLSKEIGLSFIPLVLDKKDSYSYILACSTCYANDYLGRINYSKGEKIKLNKTKIASFLAFFLLFTQVGVWSISQNVEQILDDVTIRLHHCSNQVMDLENAVHESEQTIKEYHKLVEQNRSLLNATRSKTVQHLKEIPNRTPHDVSIKNIVIDSNKIEIDGIYRQSIGLYSFISSLNELGAVSSDFNYSDKTFKITVN